MTRITKEAAISIVGNAVVAAVIGGNCDFTNRVTDGTSWHGYTEFSASVDAYDQDGDSSVTLIAYWFQDSSTVEQAESLDSLNWSEPDNYEIV